MNTAADVASFQVCQPIFCKLHPTRLPAADEHVHLYFEAAKFLQHFSLKVVVRHADHQSLRR